MITMRYVIHYADGDVDGYSEDMSSVEYAQEQLANELRGCIADVVALDLYTDKDGEMGKFIDSVSRAATFTDHADSCLCPTCAPSEYR